jgi:hypothetical protein
MNIGRLLGSGQVAEVFEFGPHVIKLYRGQQHKKSAFREGATLAALEGSGLSVPVVHEINCFDGRWGVVMSRAPASTPGSLGDAEALATLHIRLHQLDGGRLGPLKQKLAQDVERAGQLAPEHRDALLRYLAGLPNGDRLCHGDFHPGNIMGSIDEPFIVDWVDATQGPPEADACRTYLLALHNSPALAEPYLSAYASRTSRSRNTILAWLPVIAAARLAENVAAEDERLLLLAKSVPDQQ